MPINVYIPTPFRRLTGMRAYVEARGETVGDALTDIVGKFPGLGDLIFDAEGQIPNHVNIYLNNREIHALDGPQTAISEGDELAVIPALAGGCGGATTGSRS